MTTTTTTAQNIAGLILRDALQKVSPSTIAEWRDDDHAPSLVEYVTPFSENPEEMAALVAEALTAQMNRVVTFG